MIPILYEKTETEFIFNGLGRLYDCITFTITEERNGVFECEFKYPVDGVNFNQVQVGQIVAASINDSGKIQPFDIVSASKPINGVVTFYGSHISYRLNKVTASGSNINSLTDALTMLGTGTPTNPFAFEANFEASGYMSAADGTPRTVRSMLGGVEGSILATYGGEFEFDNFAVRLHESRGERRSFPIRYGVNLVDYNEEVDASESFTGVIPFWKNDVALVKGSVVDSGGSTLSGRTEIIPLDCSDKFENQPTAAQLESYARTYLSSSRPYLPKQTINVDFVNLADTLEYQEIAPLLEYKLCDTVPVVFPMYGTEADFKIVKTVYDVLGERYTSMELGQLSTTLSQALGVSSGSIYNPTGGGSDIDFDKIYPVGSIYMSMNSTNPTVLFGVGTWSLLSEGQVLLAGSTSGSYQVGQSYGRNTKKIEVANLPSHNHSISHTHPTSVSGNRFLSYNYETVQAGVGEYQVASSTSSGRYAPVVQKSNVDWGGNTNTGASSKANSGNRGDGSDFNVMQSSIAVYIWHRTA